MLYHVLSLSEKMAATWVFETGRRVLVQITAADADGVLKLRVRPSVHLRKACGRDEPARLALAGQHDDPVECPVSRRRDSAGVLM